MTRMLLFAIEAAQTLAISERLCHELRQSNQYPAPVLLSERCARWRHDDLAKYSVAPPAAQAIVAAQFSEKLMSQDVQPGGPTVARRRSVGCRVRSEELQRLDEGRSYELPLQ
jgi:predicted DNA-binding transcriptional regulator AlpA